jgi:hypothetical protein
MSLKLPVIEGFGAEGKYRQPSEGTSHEGSGVMVPGLAP